MAYLIPSEDFPGNSPSVKWGLITCVSCASVKVTPLLDRLIFSSENLDIETIEVDKQNGYLLSILCSSLSDFYCFNIQGGISHAERGFSKKFFPY